MESPAAASAAGVGRRLGGGVDGWAAMAEGGGRATGALAAGGLGDPRGGQMDWGE